MALLLSSRKIFSASWSFSYIQEVTSLLTFHLVLCIYAWWWWPFLFTTTGWLTWALTRVWSIQRAPLRPFLIVHLLLISVKLQQQHDLEQIRKKCQNNPENRRPLRSEPVAKFIQSSAKSQCVWDSLSSEAKSFHSELWVQCLTNTCARSHRPNSLYLHMSGVAVTAARSRRSKTMCNYSI